MHETKIVTKLTILLFSMHVLNAALAFMYSYRCSWVLAIDYMLALMDLSKNFGTKKGRFEANIALFFP